MVPRAVLILSFLYCLNANAQDQPLADNFVRTARADTSALPLDSTALSHLAYQIAYGSRDNRILWSIVEHIDSARINVVVRNVLAGQDGSIQIRSLEPAFEPYQKLRYHVDSLLEAKMDSLIDWNQISRTFNEYCLMNRAAGQVLIQVNIPSATLRVFGKQGNVLLECPVIVGSPSTPTPAFTAYLTRVITYPYWNVPRSIATKEFLPKIKRDPSGFLNSMKLQVFNEEGIVIDPRNIDWKKVSRKNFPYRLRQSTGCDNALGLIKFDLDSPYDIYMTPITESSLARTIVFSATAAYAWPNP